MSDDASLQQRATQFIKEIQGNIARKSLKGARELLNTQYAQNLLGSNVRQRLLEQVKQAEQKAEESFKKRIYWEWWIIFLVTCVVGGIIIYKCGIVSSILTQLRVISIAARAIIRTAVYSVSALAGAIAGYLGNCIDRFITYAFSG